MNKEQTETIPKSQSKSRPLPSTISQVPLPTIDPSSINPEKTSVSNTTVTTGSIRRPTIIPTPSPSKTTSSPIAKAGFTSTSIATTRAQQTSSMINSASSMTELPQSSVPTIAKRNVIPARSISNAAQSSMMFNPRPSPTNNQTSSNSIISSTAHNATRVGGIPRLTKTSHQGVKSTTTTTTTTGPAKRPGQVN